MILTTDDILTSIKTRGLVPTGEPTFSDTNFIQLMNEEIGLTIVPDILSVREDFFLQKSSITISGSVSLYPIPQRALGNVLKKVFYVDGSGNRYEIPRRQIVDLVFTNATTEGQPAGYMMQGDYIKIMPMPASGSGTLEVWYFERPNRLVATSSCTKITAVSSVGGTTTFTVDTDLSASWSTANTLDFVNYQSPYILWSKDVALTAVTSSTVAVATASVYDESSTSVLPGVGDYICLAGQSNIPMIPEEFHPIIAQTVVARSMEALGDLQKLQAVNGKLQEMRQAAISMIANRVEAEPVHILNRSSILNHVSGRSFF